MTRTEDCTTGDELVDSGANDGGADDDGEGRNVGGGSGRDRPGLGRRGYLAALGGASLSLLGAGGWAGSTAAAAPTDLAGRSWEQTWSDEFDGGSVDRSTWSFETGGGCGPNGTLGSCNWGNMESQYYTDGDNARVEDDRLVIEAQREQVSGRHATYQYTSSRMVTTGNVSTQYGRVDVRARMPIGQGIWPAVWMLPEGNWTWPDDGEIDVLEYLGHQPSTVHGTVHGPGFSGADGIGDSYYLADGTFHERFHVFSIVWDPESIEWFVDGERFHRVTRDEVEAAGNEWPFDDRPFHVVANVAVGGEWPGYPDETTEFPQRLELDYVRFFEESDDDSTERPPQWPDGTRPRDIDDDGTYEDLNENGRLDSDDVVTYFEHYDDPAMADAPGFYDLNDNGRTDSDDVVALFEEL